jgi:hypothetical protein
MRHSRPAVAVFIAIVAFLVAIVARRDWPSRAEEFDPAKVVAQAYETTSRSWEFGALTQALLEYENPNLTVFSLEPFPGGRIPEISHPADVEALQYAKSIIWTNHSDLLVDGEGKRQPHCIVYSTEYELPSHLWRRLIKTCLLIPVQVRPPIQPR